MLASSLLVRAVNNLHGSLPPSLARLSRLQHIDLTLNRLEDQIPEAWFQLADMHEVFLVSGLCEPGVACLGNAAP